MLPRGPLVLFVGVVFVLDWICNQFLGWRLPLVGPRTDMGSWQLAAGLVILGLGIYFMVKRSRGEPDEV